MILRSLRSRLFASTGGVVLGFLVLVVLMLGFHINRFARQGASQSLNTALHAVTRLLALEAQIHVERASALAQIPFIRATAGIPNVDQETIKAALSQLGEIASESSLLAVLDTEAKVLGEAHDLIPPGTDLNSISGIKQAYSGESSVSLRDLCGASFIVTIAPISSGDRLVGILLMGTILDQSFVDQFSATTGMGVMITRNDTLIATSGLIDREDLGRSMEVFGPNVTRESEFLVSTESATYRCMTTRIFNSEYSIHVCGTLASAAALLHNLWMWVVGIAVFVSAVGLLLSHHVIRRVCVPISQLLSASQRLSGGDLDVSVPEDGCEELAQLAMSFNTMALNINRLIADVTSHTQAQAKAEASNRAKGQFVAMVSHELRTPMNGILASLELLLDSSVDGEARELLEITHQSGRTLLMIINDILDFSKIEAGKIELESRSFCLAECLESVVNLEINAARARDLPLLLERPADLPEWVVGDSLRLRQVLLNLVSNALKFTKVGRVRLIVSTTYRSGFIRFEVIDTGVGINKSALDHIFDSFTQEDSTTTRKFGGTGLGLAISKSLVELMGGELLVESELGVGTRFYFECALPLSLPCDADPLKSASPSEHSNAFEGTHVLFVDDNATNRLLGKKLLNRLSVRVTLAIHGQEAVEQARDHSFDLILMDCSMPVLDGYEATRILRESGLSTPIIAVTAHASKEDREKCISAGMDDYMSKPFGRSDLQRVLSRYIVNNHDLDGNKNENAKGPEPLRRIEIQ